MLGIDGYQQNSDPTNQLIIKNIDTVKHQLFLKIDEKGIDQTVLRKLKLTEKGNHSYVLTKNFKGKFQLRYRGKISTLPKTVKSLILQKTIRWPEEIILLAAQENFELPSITPNITETVEKIDTASPITTVTYLAIDSIKIDTPPEVIVTAPVDTMITTMVVALEPIIDSIPIEQPTPGSTVLEDPFIKLLAEMKSVDFEFKKLNLAKNYLILNGISTQEVNTVFQSFAYDNSRLQFMKYAIERVSDKQNLKILIDSFDYELSKEQFKKTYLL